MTRVYRDDGRCKYSGFIVIRTVEMSSAGVMPKEKQPQTKTSAQLFLEEFDELYGTKEARQELEKKEKELPWKSSSQRS